MVPMKLKMPEINSLYPYQYSVFVKGYLINLNAQKVPNETRFTLFINYQQVNIHLNSG